MQVNNSQSKNNKKFNPKENENKQINQKDNNKEKTDNASLEEIENEEEKCKESYKENSSNYDTLYESKADENADEKKDEVKRINNDNLDKPQTLEQINQKTTHKEILTNRESQSQDVINEAPSNSMKEDSNIGIKPEYSFLKTEINESKKPTIPIKSENKVEKSANIQQKEKPKKYSFPSSVLKNDKQIPIKNETKIENKINNSNTTKNEPINMNKINNPGNNSIGSKGPPDYKGGIPIEKSESNADKANYYKEKDINDYESSFDINYEKYNKFYPTDQVSFDEAESTQLRERETRLIKSNECIQLRPSTSNSLEEDSNMYEDDSDNMEEMTIILYIINP